MNYFVSKMDQIFMRKPGKVGCKKNHWATWLGIVEVRYHWNSDVDLFDWFGWICQDYVTT